MSTTTLTQLDKKPTYRHDYSPPVWTITHIDLCFKLDPQQTQVCTRLHLACSQQPQPLILHGAPHLIPRSIQCNGVPLTDFGRDEMGNLLLAHLPSPCVVEIEHGLNPSHNSSLEGLYVSRGIYCSDCEPEGFRKITFFLDRPDVMATYTVKIIAPLSLPVLLSNGNPIETGSYPDNQHYAVWHDPFPKPSYLFALVAGTLDFIEDHHITPQGKTVRLRVYAQSLFIDQCAHALASLKKAMLWDEQRFGLSCDVDVYNIVAVDDFNGGAMENKGLNIFNSKYILASPDTATDSDYAAIESVIVHEYCHNWTGNRVTCRDWFQLTLKEGLTVFRDQEFTADTHHRGLKRIADVRLLRNAQFVEDAGPLSHPVRPESYIQMRNFYTATVYEKGAEIVRMYQTLLGRDGFAQGMAIYFERHDGQAVTCDDFLSAMQQAAEQRGQPELLKHFERWYSQAGTPQLHITDDYCPHTQIYQLHFTQTHRDAAQPPLLIPIKLGLLSPTGHELETRAFALTQTQQTICFKHIEQKPIPSLLREFSAPVQWHFAYNLTDLAHLITFDSDDFNRWQAMQHLALLALQETLCLVTINQQPDSATTALIRVIGHLLTLAQKDPALTAELLTLPDQEAFISHLIAHHIAVNPPALYSARTQLLTAISTQHQTIMLSVYHAHHPFVSPKPSHADSVAARHLKNTLLNYLSLDDALYPLVEAQYQTAQNMTDQLAALKLLLLMASRAPQLDCDAILSDFYHRYRDYPLVIDNWFALQAAVPCIKTLTQCQQLIQHAAFSYHTPNRVRALLGHFAANPVAFHHGQGYQWYADQLCLLDAINPQTAARLSSPFSRWQRYDHPLQVAIKQQIMRILAHSSCSADLREQMQRSVSIA